MPRATISDESLWVSTIVAMVSLLLYGHAKTRSLLLWVEVRGMAYAKVTSIHRMSRLLVASDDIRRLGHREDF
jgi:hypothetical protein